ncbi:Retrovirusrelated Pol Polyprotein from transposon 297 [Phytophthora megakarya]|uniref:Retrovirusrelated Pol Polyprotein from transposon 297 n=1 Tax=Phytophthora megakarya TaxID=4795 RepID=A0A225UPG9_9STRA|nr:Retrovirusrelated Pol Polyprotein from transposon 297 [Phytophthora megakarya]
MTKAIAGLMPNLKTKLERLAVAEESREMLFYMTDEGVFTPNRVMQGSCDSVLHFQDLMEDCFAELLHDYLLIWIDDLFLFANTIAEYLLILEKLFDLVHEFGLQLSLKKSSLYQQSVSR